MKRKAKVKIRKVWRINPRTRVKESKKLYSRKRKKRENHRIKKATI